MQEGRLAAAQIELNSAQNQLDEKQMELDEVQAMYDAAVKEKQALLDDAEACRRKMSNATALIEGLGGEKVLAHVRRFLAQSRCAVSRMLRDDCNGARGTQGVVTS